MAIPKVLISAAHTSMSPGAVFKDLREFDLTRKILQKTDSHLTNLKVEHKAVPVDLNLIQRIDWINDTGYKEESGDIFIEIHVNDGGKRGIETWFSGKAGSNNSEDLAKIVTDEVCKKTGYQNQGPKSEFEHELKSLLILNQTNPIAIAIELLYIDNDEDYKILKDDAKLDELSKALAEAIKKYVDTPPKLHAPQTNATANTGFDFGLGGNSTFGNFGLGNFGNTMGNDNILASAPGTSTTNNSLTMDRDQRKKMIEKSYKKYLNKEPSQIDLNTFLNMGISEDELLKKIIKSKDHEELVKDAKDAKELRDKSDKTESEVIKLRSEVADLKNMHVTLQNLLAHKNLQIKQMQDELVRRGVIKAGEYFDPQRTN